MPEFNAATLFFRRNRIGGVAVSDYTTAGGQTAEANCQSTGCNGKAVSSGQSLSIRRCEVGICAIDSGTDGKGASARRSLGACSPMAKLAKKT